MATLFTARTVANLKAGPTARYVNDPKIAGLAVRVAPATSGGAKTWSLRYRVGRQQRRLTLGAYPVLSLADARQHAKDALKLLSNGVDPAEAKQERRDAETVAEFATIYIEKHAKPKKKSWKHDQRRLNVDVLPIWRHRLMRDVSRRDVRELLDGIVARGAPIVANRVRSLLHKMFNVAIRLDVVDQNPVAATDRPGVEIARDRVLTPDEIRRLWRACRALPLAMAAGFKLRLVTAQRGGEVFGMRWRDVDLESGMWTIPSTDSKNKLPHRVPLSKLAVEILTVLRREETQPHHYVLAHARGKRQRSEAAATFEIVDFRGHDLRRTAASLMASAGVQRLVISKILNHVERGVTAVYDRHGYDHEKRMALEAWARTLVGITEPKDSASVVPFRATS